MSKPKFNTGLVIGKFYPFHKGHRFLIETALQNCEHLVVILCHMHEYTIDAEIRSDWIKEVFPDLDLRIFYFDPALEDERPDKSAIWAKATMDFLGFRPDVFFNSENYGEQYSKFMGSFNYLVDLYREKVPISGTKVRSDPYKYWDYLDEPVKALYAKKIVVVGAESTGTTTLARDLAKYYKTIWVPEYGRSYYEAKMFSQNANNWETSEFVHIAKMQNEMENKLLGKSNRILICDTDSFATSVWHRRYMGFFDEKIKETKSNKQTDLYLLTNTDIPFIQDGTREDDEHRQNMHQLFVDKLKIEKLPFRMISGTPEERLRQAVEEIDKLMLIK